MLQLAHKICDSGANVSRESCASIRDGQADRFLLDTRENSAKFGALGCTYFCFTAVKKLEKLGDGACSIFAQVKTSGPVC